MGHWEVRGTKCEVRIWNTGLMRAGGEQCLGVQPQKRERTPPSRHTPVFTSHFALRPSHFKKKRRTARGTPSSPSLALTVHPPLTCASGQAIYHTPGAT